jgi:hypothetical protein
MFCAYYVDWLLAGLVWNHSNPASSLLALYAQKIPIVDTVPPDDEQLSARNTSYLPAFEDGTDRVFQNVGI